MTTEKKHLGAVVSQNGFIKGRRYAWCVMCWDMDSGNFLRRIYCNLGLLTEA